MRLNKPARKIGITCRSVSGVVPGIGRYESSLERDLMESLRFDVCVKQVTPQPVTIQFIGPEGEPRSYTPDGLIYFKPELALKPILYEVKYRKDFRDSWKTLLPKMRAAKSYALSNGWGFEVFTEKEVRTTYLKNVKFLWPYREREISIENKSYVLSVMADLDEADAEFLVHALCRDKTNQAKFIPVIWNLVATGELGCDLDMPLNMRARLWSTGASYE